MLKYHRNFFSQFWSDKTQQLIHWRNHKSGEGWLPGLEGGSSWSSIVVNYSCTVRPCSQHTAPLPLGLTDTAGTTTAPGQAADTRCSLYTELVQSVSTYSQYNAMCADLRIYITLHCINKWFLARNIAHYNKEKIYIIYKCKIE